MNNRLRTKLRALLQRTFPPVMCMVPANDRPGRMVVFIDPRELEEAREKYGDGLEVLV